MNTLHKAKADQKYDPDQGLSFEGLFRTFRECLDKSTTFDPLPEAVEAKEKSKMDQFRIYRASKQREARQTSRSQKLGYFIPRQHYVFSEEYLTQKYAAKALALERVILLVAAEIQRCLWYWDVSELVEAAALETRNYGSVVKKANVVFIRAASISQNSTHPAHNWARFRTNGHSRHEYHFALLLGRTTVHWTTALFSDTPIQRADENLAAGFMTLLRETESDINQTFSGLPDGIVLHDSVCLRYFSPNKGSPKSAWNMYVEVP